MCPNGRTRDLQRKMQKRVSRLHPIQRGGAFCAAVICCYVKVTYGTKSIVVRVVTSMPSSASGIELSFAAWQALGYPPCNAGNVKIALMAEP